MNTRARVYTEETGGRSVVREGVGVRQLERGIVRKRIDGERKRNEAW